MYAGQGIDGSLACNHMEPSTGPLSLPPDWEFLLLEASARRSLLSSHWVIVDLRAEPLELEVGGEGLSSR